MEEEYLKILVRFSDLSQALPSFETLEEIRQVFEDISHCLGFRHYTYAAGFIYAGQRLLGKQPDKRPLSITNIPLDFYKAYSSNRLDHVDPILKSAMVTQLPEAWSTIYSAYPLGKREKQFIALSEDFQIYQGMVFPIHGPGNDFGVASFGTPNPLLPMHIPQPVIAALNLLLHKLHAQVRNRFRHFSSDTFTLSRREIDSLLWTSEGKSAWEIGQILGISERTVEQYITSATQKFGVTTKFAAVARFVTSRYRESA